MTYSGLSRKIWIAMSTPFQVNFFYPLIEKLKNRFDFLITARNHDRIFSMLESMGLDYVPVGKHGGTEREGKLQAYAENIQHLIPIIKKEKPDLLLTERWPEAVRVAFGFDIPAWTIFYDEREYHVNRMVFPLSSKVFAPYFYNPAELRSQGVDTNTVTWFRGFHTCYLKGQRTNNANPFLKMGYKPPIILVRPEPEFASFFGSKEKILEDTVSLLSNNGNGDDFTLTVFPRTESQLQRYKEFPVALINDAFLDNPIAYADVALGAAETMLMEAFVLGKPAISTVYWDEAKPLKVLHRYIPHMKDPKEAAEQVLRYLDPEARKEFQSMSEKIVGLMDNPLTKIEDEIHRFYGKIEGQESTNVHSKRRSQLEIYAEILRAVAFKSMKLTHIMQEVNLSYARVKSDTDLLKKKGLIEEQLEYNEVYFRATFKGLSLLNDYEKMTQKLP